MILRAVRALRSWWNGPTGPGVVGGGPGSKAGQAVKVAQPAKRAALDEYKARRWAPKYPPTTPGKACRMAKGGGYPRRGLEATPGTLREAAAQAEHRQRVALAALKAGPVAAS